MKKRLQSAGLKSFSAFLCQRLKASLSGVNAVFRSILWALTLLGLACAAQAQYTLVLDPIPSSITLGSTITLRARVTDSGGSPVSGVSVNFNIQGASVMFAPQATTNASGVASQNWTFSPSADYAATTSISAVAISGTNFLSNVASISSIALGAGNTPPGAPTGVTAQAPMGATSAAADVYFSPPGYVGTPALTGYTATATPGGASATCSMSPCRITGLTFGTAYTFTVYASNTAGAGPTSAASAPFTPLSSNNYLADLTVSGQTLAPGFDRLTSIYTVSVPNGVTTASLAATTEDSTATLAIAGTTVASGASHSVNLNVGANTIFVQVRAANGALRTYRVSITRAASSDATLASLSLSTGALSPAFSAATTAYTVSLPHTTTSLLLTPVAASSVATLRFNGSVITNGTAQPVSLPVGSTSVTVQVTAQDSATVLTYTLTINRAPSSDATLASLGVSTGTLSPAFAPGTTSYVVNLPNSATNLSVTPALASATAALRINGAVATSGAAYPVTLQVGATTVSVQVAAQDGTTVLTYTLTINRAASSDATLASLGVSSGTLSPAFSAGVSDYTLSLPYAITNLSLTPVLGDTTAALEVNGAPVTSGATAGPFALALGSTTLSVRVTAQDGATRNTYRIAVTRAQALGTLILTSSATTAFQGASVTLTATYNGPVAATGTVTFFNGGAALASLPLAGNRAVLTVSSLPAGNLSLTARFNGDTESQPVTSAPLGVLINARPSPANDPSVKAMVSAQMSTAMRFGQTQLEGVANRLEQLHEQDEGEGSGGGSQDSAGNAAPLSGLTGALNAFEGKARPHDPMASSQLRQGSDLGRGLQRMSMMLPAFAQAINRRGALPFEIWAGTSLGIGRLRQDGRYDQHFNNAHLVIGMDRRFTPDLRAGIAFSGTFDTLDIGTDGSGVRGVSPSATLYASWRFMPQAYLDVLGGVGHIRLRTQRYTTLGGTTLEGTRTGRDLFGALGLTRRFALGDVKVSLYTRFDMMAVRLDGYAERGDPLWAIRYGATSGLNYAAVVGGRFSSDIQQSWGTLTPTLRLEYRHAFQGRYTQAVAYIDGVSSGLIVGAGSNRSQFSAGLGLRARLDNDLALELGYLLSGSPHGLEGQRFTGSMRYSF